MEFLTLHELSLHLDVPERVVRYRFHKLRIASKLIEGPDYRRDDFVDDHHFIWKINPVGFMRETGIKPTTESFPAFSFPETKSVSNPAPVVNQSGNQPPSPATNSVNTATSIVNELPRVDTKPEQPIVGKAHDSGFEREVIDLLKDQIRVKDRQIEEMTLQVRANNEMQINLMGATLKQSQTIENLLRLESSHSEFVTAVENTKPISGNQDAAVDNNSSRTVVNHGNQDEITRAE